MKNKYMLVRQDVELDREDLVYSDGAIVEVTKEFTFDSSHHLNNYVGKCQTLHGHTYKLQVTLEGNLDDRGIVVDFKDLKAIVNKYILEPYDHKYLNAEMSFNTTAENMVVFFFETLSKHLEEYRLVNQVPYIKLKEVKLWETPTSYASFKGEIRHE